MVHGLESDVIATMIMAPAAAPAESPPPPFEPVDADRVERLECIGRGSYGDVYRG